MAAIREKASRLFEPLSLRSVTLRNRIVVAPMCQYQSQDGFANDWHLVHLGSRAVGGAALVITEAAAVEPRGRISPRDLGIWCDDHIEMLARINQFIELQGALGGVQLAHAGRKGSVGPPWAAQRGCISPDEGGWTAVAPTAARDKENYPMPKALEPEEIAAIVQAFADGARRTNAAGFAVAEIHAGHGYLVHQFLSPLSNARDDRYGGTFENRIRLLLEIVDAVRCVWPENKPLFVRISATDWHDGGWTIEESIEVGRILAGRGVDLIDVTSGGIAGTTFAGKGEGPLYQVPFARRIRIEANVPTAAVGVITTADEAESVLADGSADLVAIGRRFLGDPYFPYRAAHVLDGDLPWPPSYIKALV
jgi:2,4-dienoyl-CoA reductase-like NADH-dependent reductase (Old Yellow Enzyme family)